MKRRFTVLLEWHPDGPGYGVIVRALPGCFSQDETVQEALERLRQAIAGHVAARIELGEPVPAEDVPALVTTVGIEDAIPIGA